jgi:hypothetical protein
LWEIEENPPPFPTKTANKSFVDLILKPSGEELKNWHRFLPSHVFSIIITGSNLPLFSLPVVSYTIWSMLTGCSLVAKEVLLYYIKKKAFVYYFSFFFVYLSDRVIVASLCLQL